MDIWIKGITPETRNRLSEEAGARVEKDYYYNNLLDLYDVLLSEAAILKAYDDRIIVDLGGNLSSLYRNEFIAVTI